MLDDKLKALWTRISPPQKAAFFGCLLSGYLVHLYVFTNIIPNSDGLSRIFDPQQMTVSGRWFLHFASYFNGFTQMPAVIGLFSVLFLALAAALAVSLLGIRSRALSALSGALMAAFPAVGYTFLYLFTASAYCFAIFLAVLSVSLARRGRWHWLAGCLLLACSMGTYQAYVTVAIGLSLLVIFRETLDPSASFSATLRLGVRLMLFLAAGAVLYYGILLVFLQVKDLELLSYLGMDAASSGYPFSRLPGLLLDTYKQVAAFFFLPGSANTFTSGWMAVLDLAALALGGGCFLLCMGQEGLWRARWRPLGGLAMLIAGIGGRGRGERYVNYLAYIGANREVDLARMAAAFDVSVRKLCKDLRHMLAKGILPTGYLDMAEGKLYLTEMGYRAPEPEEEADPQEKAEQDAQREDAILREIRQVNDEIPDERMSAQIDLIERLTAQIFNCVRQHPEKLSQIRQFLNYYLPTTIKLMEQYVTLQNQNVKTENITEGMQKIEDLLDKVIVAFQRQLDALFESDVVDITADIRVMEQMMASEGLTNKKDFA